MSRAEEAKTIRNRSFELKLSTADVDRLFEKAASVGLTPHELLENFIGDLVNGTYTNGSDERMYANEWFDRCGFSYLDTPKSFLGWLLQDNTGDTLCCYADDWLLLKEYEAQETLDEDEALEMDSIKTEVESDFEDYKKCRYCIPDATLETEMQKVVAYRNERQAVMVRRDCSEICCDNDSQDEYEME